MCINCLFDHGILQMYCQNRKSSSESNSRSEVRWSTERPRKQERVDGDDGVSTMAAPTYASIIAIELNSKKSTYTNLVMPERYIGECWVWRQMRKGNHGSRCRPSYENSSMLRSYVLSTPEPLFVPSHVRPFIQVLLEKMNEESSETVLYVTSEELYFTIVAHHLGPDVCKFPRTNLTMRSLILKNQKPCCSWQYGTHPNPTSKIQHEVKNNSSAGPV